MQFPTGGIVRKLLKELIRCNSETDGIVRMGEGIIFYMLQPRFFRGYFIYWEKNNMSKYSSTEKSNITKLVITAMLSAVAVALQYIEVSIPLVPSFLKLDFSDIPELIGAFIIGPSGGVLICLIKNLIHLPFTSSVGVGEFSNFLLGAVFSFIAGIIYKHHKTKKTALLACLAGSAAMTVVSVISNYFIVYPAFAKLWAGGDMNVIISMYKALLPASDTLIKSLLIFNVPFTFVKGLICATVTMLIYKPLSNIFVRLNTQINKKTKKPA